MIKLYVLLIAARIRSQMQYRVSFWLELLGFALVTFLEFAVVAILLARFGSVAGWTTPEVALLYGLTSFAFSMAEIIGRGFDAPFERMMASGAFDGVLSRPLDSFVQILASDFQLRRLGRTVQALIILIYAFANAPIVWDASRALLIPFTIAAGSVIYMALLVIGATIAFWTIRIPEVVNAFTFGGEQMTTYPLSIYNAWLRTIFFVSYQWGL
jgi:ABC-2 type transport system permease protein